MEVRAKRARAVLEGYPQEEGQMTAERRARHWQEAPLSRTQILIRDVDNDNAIFTSFIQKGTHTSFDKILQEAR
jgi:hypothetical protein